MDKQYSEQRVEFGETGQWLTTMLAADACRPEYAAEAMVKGGSSSKYVEKR